MNALKGNFPDLQNNFVSIFSKRIRSCDVCAEAYTEHHVHAEKDIVDGEEERYIELKGDEILKYEAEPAEDAQEDKVINTVTFVL